MVIADRHNAFENVAKGDLIDESCELAAKLLTTANKLRGRRDSATRKRFSRLLHDRDALLVTMALADEVMRTPSTRAAARSLRLVVGRATARGFGVVDSFGLRLVGLASLVSSSVAIRGVRAVVRAKSSEIILSANIRPLSRHIYRRRSDGARPNINVLGEAVLGDTEAKARLLAVTAMAERSDVDYVSVKISSVVAQIMITDLAGSVDRVVTTLRPLYRAAVAHGTFVNLDMEEYRDLEITMIAFMRLLDEPEFETLTAGIVLQAYLPEAHDALEKLVDWAHERHARSGGVIKIRLVKGANLAMENTEAELHGWVAAPYQSKALVDASYVRMLNTVLSTTNSQAVRVGVASHNLFHLAYALTLARHRGVTQQIDIEMLEGMANAEALAIAREVGGVVLYTPVTNHDDFVSAVAYLVRRLDENTSPENYLRASFAMQVDNQAWVKQRERFIASVRESKTLSTVSRRHELMHHNADASFARGEFINEPDGDPTRQNELPYGLAVPAREIPVATATQVDESVASAKHAQTSWNALGSTRRGEILRNVAQVFADQRRATIALMMSEAGKTFAEADPEVSEAIDFARFYALQARRVCDHEHASALGVVLVVPPWNFPYAIPVGGVCAALSVGNTVILKPAPETVQIAQHLVEQMWFAGVPRDVLRFVRTNDDEVGRHLITHNDVAAVVLTGGFATAQMFLEWKPELQLFAETSGKNAIVVSASADIDLAVKDIVQSAFGHAGQKCSAASLAIVDQTIFDHPSFLGQLRDAVESLRVGWGNDPATNVGPLIREPSGALHRALHQLDEGESWLVEPQVLSDDQRLYRPGVRLGVRPGSWAHRTEWFGPVLGVMRAPNLGEAIKWQNAVDFGLTAGIQALNPKDCEFWLKNVRAGNLYVNRTTTGAIVGRQPFGGWRKSSVGAIAKAGGPHYIESLLNWRSVENDADADLAIVTALKWWTEVGSVTRETAGLRAERNYSRYFGFEKVLVVIDEFVQSPIIRAVTQIAEFVGVDVIWHKILEGECKALGDEFVHDGIERARWLSVTPPTREIVAMFAARGVSIDRRPIAVRGDIEAPRWLKEQSIAITNHRYGNIGSGPQIELSSNSIGECVTLG